MTATVDPLFRPEVAGKRTQRLEGEILLVQPVRTHALVLLLCAIVASIGLWLALGTYTRTESARGLLVTSDASAKVIAMRPGQVVRMLVREGDRVAAGQMLALVRTEQAGERGESAIAESLGALEEQRALTAEQVQLAARRAQSDRNRLAATLAGLRQRREDISGQIGIQEQVVASTRDIYARIERVLESGFVSRIEVERRRQAWLAAQQQLAQLNEQRNVLAADEARAVAELGRIEADAGSEAATASASGQSLAQQQARLRSERGYTVTAPVAGRVAAVQAAVGRSVDASVPLMEIVPEGSPLTAHIFAPTRAIGFIRPGQEAQLLYDAFPYQRFGSFRGQIIAVSRVAIDPRQLAAPFEVDEPVYRIEVAPDAQEVSAYGDRLALQPGMMLSANIVLDRRSFLDWLRSPLNAVLERNGG